MARIQVMDLSGSKALSLEEMEQVFGGAGTALSCACRCPAHSGGRAGSRQAAYKSALQGVLSRRNAVLAKVNALNAGIANMQGQVGSANRELAGLNSMAQSMFGQALQGGPGAVGMQVV